MTEVSYRCDSITRTLIIRIVDNPESVSGMGIRLEVPQKITRNPSFYNPDKVCREFELAQTCKATNALHRAHSRLLLGTLPPDKAPANKPKH